MSERCYRLLLVDDDESLLQLLQLRLAAEGYDVIAADSGAAAVSVLQQQSIDVVLTDLRMDGMDGMVLFDEISKSWPQTPVIIMTAHGSIDEAVVATQRGVVGFLTKPLDHDALRKALDKAKAFRPLNTDHNWRSEIITRSQRMLQLLEQAERVAQLQVSILIQGASGTGKELLARAIHNASPRANKPFVALNCGALPEHLLESELFGHAKGAFTGASHAYSGLFRSADGGTLLLDEIGDMPLNLQVKLLRALQERQVRPVGSVESIPVDVRVLSSTHRDLTAAMQAGEFREDLYYRLNVVNLVLPSLRERAEDIPLLARHLLTSTAARFGSRVNGFDEEALKLLTEASWPGNVRQLVNVVEQCVALCTGHSIGAPLVQQALAADDTRWPTLVEARNEFERKYLVKVLSMTEGQVTRAAELSGRNRTDFYKLLKRYELDAADFKPSASDPE